MAGGIAIGWAGVKLLRRPAYSGNAVIATRSLMWPAYFFVSVALHAAVIFSVGVKQGKPVSSAKAFTVVDFHSLATVQLPHKNVSPQIAMSTDETVAGGKTTPETSVVGLAKANDNILSFEQSSPTFYKSSEVSHIAQLQLPMDAGLFSSELSLSGRLVLDISISDGGKVVGIEVVEAMDVSGALRAYMLPLLRAAPFTPAFKEGRPVNSVRRVEFTLGIVIEEPKQKALSTVPPGFRPQMDARGNVLKNQPKP